MISDRDLDYVEKRLKELGRRFVGKTMTTSQFLRLERAVDDFRIEYNGCASSRTTKKKHTDPDYRFDRAMRGI